jgi:hypothetical protein
MLNQVPTIIAPHPPHIMERLMPLLDRYGDLSVAVNFAQLVEDVCRLVETNPVPWEGVTLSRADIMRRCKNHSLVAIYGAVHDALAEAHGKHNWLCKSLTNVHYLDELEGYFDKPHYLYLYRDGRDAALSFSKAIVGEKHFYHIAQQWHKEQQLVLKFQEKMAADRFFAASYEQLTDAPEPVLRWICKFLGVEFHPEMMEFHSSKEASRTAQSGAMWANVNNPVIAGNSQKFLKEVSEAEIRAFETVAGDSLDHLGYERVFVRRGEARAYTADEISAMDAENQRRKQAIRAQIPPEDLKQREPQEQLMAEIRARPRKV